MRPKIGRDEGVVVSSLAGMANTSRQEAPSVWASTRREHGKQTRPRRWRRRLAAAGLLVAALAGAWVAVHRVPWVGPMVADGLRAVIGIEGVAKLEDFVYGLEDRVNLAVRGDEAPRAYWDVPAAPPAPLSPTKLSSCEVAAFAPVDVGPMHAKWSAPGDGTWVGIADARRPEAAPRLYKTLLHPDPNRSWTAVSVVAIDLRRVDLHLVAGRHEPKPKTKEGRAYQRTGLVPSAHHEVLLAAFNGGFKAEHGQYGMHVDGVTLLEPRSLSCWVAHKRDGGVVIGDYERLGKLGLETTWWRQAPACMVDASELHPGLRDRENTYWGATLDGKTVIRRSAIGLSADGDTLLVGIGDHTNARAIATAMKHAGAAHVAQLDVNWSYPKFVLYKPTPRGLIAEKLCEGFEHSEDEYVRRPAERDFFYLTAKSDAAIEAAACQP